MGECGVGGGASGDEIYRFDLASESPTCCEILASSTGYPDNFGIVVEDVSFPISGTLVHRRT